MWGLQKRAVVLNKDNMISWNFYFIIRRSKGKKNEEQGWNVTSTRDKLEILQSQSFNVVYILITLHCPTLLNAMELGWRYRARVSFFQPNYRGNQGVFIRGAMLVLLGPPPTHLT